MAEQRRKLSARAILSDMKAGLSDDEIMNKYRLRPDQFARIFNKLVEAKLIRPGRGGAAPKVLVAIPPSGSPSAASGKATRPQGRAQAGAEDAHSATDHTEITGSLFAGKEPSVQQGVLFTAMVKPGVSIYPESIGAAEGTVYFFTDSRGFELWGIDLSQSEVKWRFQLDEWLESPVREHQGLLYFAGTKRLYCVDCESGESRWIEDHPVLPSSDWIVGGDACLYLDQENSLTAVDLATGKIRWVSGLEGAVAGSVSSFEGGVCVTGSDGRLYGLDVLTGEEKWRFHMGEVSDSVPIVRGKIIFAANADGYLYALDSDTGEVIWRFDSGYGIVASPAVAAGVVCVAGGDQALYALDVTAGRQIWRKQLKTAPSASGLIEKGILCSWSAGGELIAMDLTTGNPKWTWFMGQKSGADPTLLRGLVVVSEKQIVRALNLSSGEEIWRLDLPERVDEAPLFAAGVFLIPVGRRMLYAIDARGPGEDPDPRLLIRIDGEPRPKQDLIEREQEQARRDAAKTADPKQLQSDAATQARTRASSSITLKIIAGIVCLIGFVLTLGWLPGWRELSFSKVAVFVCSGLMVMAVGGALYWQAKRLHRRQE